MWVIVLLQAIYFPGSLAEDSEYSYVVPFDKTLSDFPDVHMPKCGSEIKQVDVSKVTKPNQIRLSYTGDPYEMAITWTTNGVTNHEKVVYGVLENDLNYTANSISHQYKWHWDQDLAKWLYISGFIHEALMINLVPGMQHFYQIESNNVKSPVYSFIASPKVGATTPLSFLHTADVGTFPTSVLVTATMIKRLETKKTFNGILHCGDISYANKYKKKKPHRAAQHVWDTWGMIAQPISSRMAYIVTPGNHEVDEYDSTMENGTIYSKRFILPGNEHYYTFSMGMVTFVSVSTDEDIDPQSDQGVWLDRTLAKVDRSVTPWLVIFQHRPIYNSNLNHGNWSGESNYTYADHWDKMPTYEGWPDDFEALILKYDVDFVLAGHVHHYERTWPVRNRNEVTKSYDDVKSPVHITCGHGGKTLYRIVWGSEDKNTYNEHVPAFSAARDNENWGHCEIEFLDATRAKHSMYLMEQPDAPKEEVIITKKRSRAERLSPRTLLLVLVLLIRYF